MNLFLAILIIYAFNMAWWLYPIAIFIWIYSQLFRYVQIKNSNERILEAFKPWNAVLDKFLEYARRRGANV